MAGSGWWRLRAPVRGGGEVKESEEEPEEGSEEESEPPFKPKPERKPKPKEKGPRRVPIRLDRFGSQVKKSRYQEAKDWSKIKNLVHEPLTVVASPVTEHSLQTCKLSGHSSRAQPLRSM